MIKKLFSRKFIALVIATFLVWNRKIESSVWLVVALAYISVNLVQKWIERGLKKE